MLRSLLGTLTVTPGAIVDVDLAGQQPPLDVHFLRGEALSMASPIVSGRWLEGPGEVAHEMLLYGRMPPTNGLDVFYRAVPGSRFRLQETPLDLWVIFCIHPKIHPESDERIFSRCLVTH